MRKPTSALVVAAAIGVAAIVFTRISPRAETLSIDQSKSDQNPVTAINVLVSMSTFSALASSILTDQELETQLTSGGTARVLLFAGRGGEQAVVGSFDKLTTMLRRHGSVEVSIPTGGSLQAGDTPLPAGWEYSVQLEPQVTACCDGGDGQCAHRSGDAAQGSLNRSIAQLHPEGKDVRRVVLTLTHLPPPPVRTGTTDELQPSALIRVTSAGGAAAPDATPDTGGGAALRFAEPPTVACTLQVKDTVVANGELRTGSSTPNTMVGTLDLTYRK